PSCRGTARGRPRRGGRSPVLPAGGATGGGPWGELDGCGGRGGPLDEAAERAHLARCRRAAARAGPKLHLVGDAALLGGHRPREEVPGTPQEAQVEVGLAARGAQLELVQRLLVAEVLVPHRHRALVDLVVDAA